MKRQIKFRAWHKDFGEMVFSETNWIFEKREFCPFEFRVGFSNYPAEKWELMQFTGLTDKNGVEIYEGDIINGIFEMSDNWQTNKFSYKNLKVTYSPEFACFTACSTISNTPKFPYESYLNFLYQMSKIEVIGNVFENPELLNN